eukprot:4038-Hanusia_phi.AAC.2
MRNLNTPVKRKNLPCHLVVSNLLCDDVRGFDVCLSRPVPSNDPGSPLSSVQRRQVVKDARPGGSHEKGASPDVSLEQDDLSFEEAPSYSQYTEEDDDYMSLSHAFHRLGE